MKECPMCKSSEVYTTTEFKFMSSNAALYVRGEMANIVPQTPFVPYICLSCGFTALYAKDMAALKEIPNTKGWEKAGK